MEVEIAAIEKMKSLHEEKGAALYRACNAKLFPCDILAFTVMERSLNLIRGFCLLLVNGGYTCGVALLRMQFDNLLRFHGVVTSIDPHEVASQMINGTPLRKIKDKTDQLMTDKRLVEQLSVRNPWAERVYNLASGYIHLSEHHFYHFLQRSKQNESGTRDIVIGDEDDCLSPEHKLQLVNAFAVVTRGVLELIHQWTKVRDNYGMNEALKGHYTEI